MYFLRCLKSYGVKQEILVNFYTAIIESVLTYAVTVWFGGTNKKDEKKLNSVIRLSSKIIGIELPQMAETYDKRLIRKANSILKDKLHPAQIFIEVLPSGKRYRAYKGNARLTNSTYPNIIKLFNEHKN